MKKLLVSCLSVVVLLLGATLPAHATFTVYADEEGYGYWFNNDDGNSDGLHVLESTTSVLPEGLICYGIIDTSCFMSDQEALVYTLPEEVNPGIVAVMDGEDISQLLIFSGLEWFVLTEACDNENEEGCAPAEFADWDALLAFLDGTDLIKASVQEVKDLAHYAPEAGQPGNQPGNEYNVCGDELTVCVVPEPTTIALLSLGLIGLGLTRRRMKV